MKKLLNIASFFAFLGLSVTSLSMQNAGAQELCTKQDLKNIRSFDRKAKKNQEKMQEYIEEQKRKRPDPDDREESPKEIKEFQDFYFSEEYEAMKPVYERCGKKIPKTHTGYEPFWLPEN